MLAISLLIAGSAYGAPATADVADPEGDNGASFERQPTDVRRVAISWDDATLSVRITYEQLPETFALRLVMSAMNKQTGRSWRCHPWAAESIDVRASARGVGVLEVPYVDGSVRAEGEVNLAASTITYRFAHEALTEALGGGSDPFTCLSGVADGDDFYGAFDGKLLKLRPREATAAFRDHLARRYGPSFRRADRTWVECPKEELFEETDDFSAFVLCEFEFGRKGGRYRSGTAQAMILDGRYTIANLRSWTYRKRMQTCRIARTKRGWVNGAYLTNRRLRNSQSLGKGKACRYLVGGAGMAGDLEYSVIARTLRRKVFVGMHGTNRAGFEERALFPCRVRRSGSRYRFDCRNELGDRFVYSFTVRR